MFRHLVTVMRGRAARAEEAFDDAHALLILEQQMREGTAAVTASRKAVALAIAQCEAERQALVRLEIRIADLETRTLAALESGQEALAREAAESIALLEGERDALRESVATFEADIVRLRKGLRSSEHRLRELRRGQRIANAADRAARVREIVADGGVSALAEAETTLEKLRARQTEGDVAAAAMESLDPERASARMSERLAEAGCGAPITTTADAVIERLRERAGVPGVAKPA